MYESFFGLNETPFSIAPDPRYLYMSDRHKEALAHLLYGLEREGGFVLLTGEVGTGKTTVCRRFLQNVPDDTEVAFILYPKLTARELLATICDEIGIRYPIQATTKLLIDLIYKHLLEAHAQGKHTALIIDEAQNLTIDVLEQLRLLTNLETDKKKLLQIILLGQPELTELLERRELRQLSQRVTARYHLGPLSLIDLNSYISFRLNVAGCSRPLFTRAAIRKIHSASRGIPRIVNLICDRALLGAYSRHEPEVKPALIKEAVQEVGARHVQSKKSSQQNWILKGTVAGVLAAVLTLFIAYMVSPNRQFRGLNLDSPSQVANEQGQTLPASPNGEAKSLVTLGEVVNVTDPKPIDRTPRNTNQEETKPTLKKDSLADSEFDTQSSDDQGEQLADALLAQTVGGYLVDGQEPSFEAFENYQVKSNNLSKSYDSLLSQWQLKADTIRESSGIYCNWVLRRGLECMHGKGSWRSLLKLNRPAILMLLNRKGEKFSVTLTQLSKDLTATLELDGKQHKLPLTTLDSYWHGQYSLLWKVPPYQSQVIQPGAVQDQSLWLKTQLNIRDAKLQVTNNRKLALKERVKAFQKEVGIIPDGIPGKITLIMLNTWTQTDVPLLMTKQES